MNTKNLSTLKIHKLTKEQYDRELIAGRIDPNALYLTPDEETDLSMYATIEDLNNKADISHKHTISDVANLQTVIDSTLVSAKTYTDTAVSGKANSSHIHDDRYYTETEVDTKIADINESISNITSGGVVVAEAIHAQTTNEATHASSSDSAIKATQDSNGKVISSTYETKVDAIGKLAEAKEYADTVANGKADSGHSHDNVYDAKGSASAALESAKTYTDEALSDKANAEHTHDDRYYTEAEIDDKIVELNTSISSKANSNHNHDTAYDAKGAADTALASAKTYADSAATTAATKVKDELLNGAGTAYDTLKELGDLIVDNQDAIEALETIASGKANAEHTHEIADVSGLQSALDGKAASSHTHTVSQISDLTATATELNYMDGVTSNVQTQLDGKSDSGHGHTITATATDDDVIVLTGTNGSNKVTFDAKHAKSGVTAGTYKSVTVNAYGHVTGGTNPTTISGYGIADAYTKTQVDTALSGKSDSGHTHNIATTSATGMMSADMVTKLNGIATGATKVTVDSALSSSSTNPVQNKVVNNAISTLTSTVSANTSSISAHNTAITNLQTAVLEIKEITSEEIHALFAN